MLLNIDLKSYLSDKYIVNNKEITKREFNKKFPKVKTHLKFDTPEWKIQVGNYKTTLEADKALININLKFSGAIVIPINK